MKGEGLEEYVYLHFKLLFGTRKTFCLYLKDDVWENEVVLSDLHEEFQEEEIKSAV